MLCKLSFKKFFMFLFKKIYYSIYWFLNCMATISAFLFCSFINKRNDFYGDENRISFDEYAEYARDLNKKWLRISEE